MLSYELFSLAADLRHQAVECERVRDAVDLVWHGLDQVLAGPVARHGAAIWMSAAADASRLLLRQQHSHLIRLRFEIEQVARRLQAHADELYADAARVEMAAGAARQEEAQELTTQSRYFQ